MCPIFFSLAKPGKAMLGPYSSLMVLRRGVRPGAVPDGRSVGGKRGTAVSADGALIRLLTSNKDSGTRRSAARATVRSGSVS